jgi:hypothetical protein
MTVQSSSGDFAAPAAAELECGPLPVLLRQEAQEEYALRYREHYQPVGPVELAIVRDLARQAAAMEQWGVAVGAVERQAARGLVSLAAADGASPDELEDAVLAAAVSCDATDRCERHSLGHSRAFYRALQKLEELQARRRKHEQSAPAAPPPPFADEAACEAYLAQRLRDGRQPCRRCGETVGYYYPARRAWECHGCGAQSGLRTGTVMARSPVSLWAWFQATRLLLWRPTVRAAELGQVIGVKRPATVCMIARKIRTAIAADNCSQLLAGLDRYYARQGGA